MLPGLVDVGFLGRMAFPLPVRLALHLPLAVTLLAAGLAALIVLSGEVVVGGHAVRAGQIAARRTRPTQRLAWCWATAC